MIKYRNTTNLDEICMPLDLENFSQVTEDFNAFLPCNNPDVYEIISDSIAIEIISQKVVDSPKGISAEGFILTGKTLIVILDIKVKYQYISVRDKSTVYGYTHTHSTIVPVSLSESYNPSFSINPNVFIEDLYYSVESPKKIFNSVTFLVAAEQIIGGC